MLKVSPLRDSALENFKNLFTDYYAELGCDDDCEHLVSEYIVPDLLAGLIKIDVLSENDKLSGFIIYQQDDINNDWNFMEGFGDIREIYVVPSLRRTGAGTLLLYTAEMRLRESGVKKSYALPALGSEPFFEACGYKKTDGYSAELDSIVYVKENLDNSCGKHVTG